MKVPGRDGGLSEVGEPPGADERVVDGVGWVEDALQVRLAVRVALVDDRAVAPGELHEAEHRGRS